MTLNREQITPLTSNIKQAIDIFVYQSLEFIPTILDLNDEVQKMRKPQETEFSAH